MATYYIRPDGSNSNSGTGSGTGSAWATIGKALATGSTVVGGDTVYVAPGTYREAITVGISPSSNVNITADPKALQFSGMTAGPVIWSGFNNATNPDDSNPTGTPCNLGTNGNWTFTDFVVHGTNTGSNGNCFNSSTSASNITWLRCVLIAQSSSCIRCFPANNAATLNWVIDSCVFHTNGSCFACIPTATGGSSTIDLGITIKNSIFYGGGNACVALAATGTGSTFGGFTIYNCVFYAGSYGFYATPSAALTTTYKAKIRNCLFTRQLSNCILESLSNFVDEDYNRIIDTTARSVTTAGTNTKTAGILGVDAGAGLIQGFAKYHPDMPQVAGILTGDGTATGAPTLDIFSYTRPGTPSVGPAEQNAFSSGSSGGLIVHPGMTGGMRG
jgi:hypothetical protein